MDDCLTACFPGETSLHGQRLCTRQSRMAPGSRRAGAEVRPRLNGEVTDVGVGGLWGPCSQLAVGGTSDMDTKTVVSPQSCPAPTSYVQARAPSEPWTLRSPKVVLTARKIRRTWQRKSTPAGASLCPAGVALGRRRAKPGGSWRRSIRRDQGQGTLLFPRRNKTDVA